MRRAIAAASAVVILAVALAGCTFGDPDDDLSTDYSKSAGRGYASDDGAVVVPAREEREDTPRWSATDDAGGAVSSRSLSGKVVVLNFWYAGCPPCRVEAPDLAKLHAALAPKGVEFLGVNTQDSAVTARGFAEKYGLDYASVLDAQDNVLTQTFAGDVAPNAVPVTLVLDRQGRVAARFSGAISSVSTVEDVVDDVLAEKD